MIKQVLEILLAISFFIWGRWFADINLQPELYGMSIGFTAALLLDTIIYLYSERTFLKLYWDCIKPFQTRTELRLSISYLFRIEINGKYLLVKSTRIDNTYQPVGGVYKYFYPEAKKNLERVGAITDNYISNDDRSEFDLRLKMLDRKNIRKFLKWFSAAEEREWDPWREFYEELVLTGILPASDFGYIHYELIGQHFDRIHFDNHFKIDTFKYADIYNPKYVNNKQREEMKKLQQAEHTDYIWVTEDEIKNGKSKTGQLIADHSYKIFHTKKLN